MINFSTKVTLKLIFVLSVIWIFNATNAFQLPRSLLIDVFDVEVHGDLLGRVHGRHEHVQDADVLGIHARERYSIN